MNEVRAPLQHEATSPALPRAASLIHRARNAVALTIGFYVLALTIASLLLYIPYAEARYSESHEPQLLVLWIAAGAILWSILPRLDHFEAPGARLVAQREPHLFAVIRRVAEATGQRPPTEIYVVQEMNAWVSSRGGFLGFGARRILGVGLPLLQELTVSQLQAVLAHEFGHYRAGDVKLGPLIYQTRAAIGRTVTTLVESGVILIQMVHMPFLWYGRFFLGFTHAISRNQELHADALSAHLVGQETLVTALESLQTGAPAFDLYWRAVVTPVLTAGFRPPLANGYRLFRAAPQVSDKLEALATHSRRKAVSDPYDTHPPLQERLAQIQALTEGREQIRPALPADTRMAIELLCDVDHTEAELLRAIATDPAAGRALKPIDWESVGERVMVGCWRRNTARAAAALGRMTAADAPTDRDGLEALARCILGPRARGAQKELAAAAASVIAGAVTCNLVAAGWTVELLPGQSVLLRRGNAELRPFAVMLGLVSGEKQPADWNAVHEAGGVSDMPLAGSGRLQTPRRCNLSRSKDATN